MILRQVWREVDPALRDGYVRACTAHVEGRDEAGKVQTDAVAGVARVCVAFLVHVAVFVVAVAAGSIVLLE